MKSLLIDTNIFIDYFRNGGNSPYNTILEEPNCFVSYVSCGELLQGARDKRELKNINKLLKDFKIDYGSKRISEMALSLMNEYRLRSGLDIYDALIASTAMEYDAEVVTLNSKHFKAIKGLIVSNFT